MKNILPKRQTPDFSFIRLDNQTILNLSKQIGNYSMTNEVSIREI